MNCCDYNCNQGRECPARAGHAPPPVPGSLVHVPYLRRTCEELGVCQAYVPRCGKCNDVAAGNADVNITNGLDSLLDQIFYWGLVLVMAMASVITLAGAAGFLYVRFFQ